MKRIIELTSICLIAIAMLAGCSSEKPGNAREAGGVEFTDALEHEIAVSGYDKVIAATSSFAQVWQLAGGKLIGATTDAFEDGLITTGEATDVGGAHNPSLEQMIALSPDLVILSADLPGHVKLYEQLNAAGITAAYFSVEVFEDYLSMLKICTDITGRADLYKQNGESIRERIDEIITRTKDKPSPKVLLLRASSGKVEARNSETMAGKMLRDMGCVNIADSETGLLENLSMEVIIKEDPDYIFVTIMGDSEEKAQEALRGALLQNPAWAGLTAVKNNRYITLPKDLFHQKPNNRWAESYELLWKTLYGK
mgnify:CR=1 FL=1